MRAVFMILIVFESRSPRLMVGGRKPRRSTRSFRGRGSTCAVNHVFVTLARPHHLPTTNRTWKCKMMSRKAGETWWYEDVLQKLGQSSKWTTENEQVISMSLSAAFIHA